MKVKLDENLGAMGAVFLAAAGFDVATAADQNLLSRPDADLARICAAEGRCFVTLDKDFSDPLRYPPSRYAGIIVVRLPASSGYLSWNAHWLLSSRRISTLMCAVVCG